MPLYQVVNGQLRQVGVNTANAASSALTTEDAFPLTDESGATLTSE